MPRDAEDIQAYPPFKSKAALMLYLTERNAQTVGEILIDFQNRLNNSDPSVWSDANEPIHS